MVNALRTLLLNISGTNNPGPLYPGEQYVPVTYVARTLPSALQTTREALFGIERDRSAINYRLQEILSFIHASDLAGFATNLDPRITYLPFSALLYEATAPPAYTFQEAIVALLQLPSNVTVPLFGVDPPEPFLTFRNLWQMHPAPIYKAAGAVLALAYQINLLEG